jgi:hypothetical protein
MGGEGERLSTKAKNGCTRRIWYQSIVLVRKNWMTTLVITKVLIDKLLIVNIIYIKDEVRRMKDKIFILIFSLHCLFAYPKT